MISSKDLVLPGKPQALEAGSGPKLTGTVIDFNANQGVIIRKIISCGPLSSVNPLGISIQPKRRHG